MQCATIEYARQVSKLDQCRQHGVRSATPNRVIYKLRELLGVDEMGGTMRLGAWPCKLEPGSIRGARLTARRKFPSAIAIATNSIANTKRRSRKPGFRITGRTPDGIYVEIVEVPDHPWFVGCQFHPEFKSKPLAPHPLFAAFIRASVENRQRRLGQSSSVAAADSASAD